ncbi:unnamed protein product [Linum tenue]|uniref:Uncharacterized protein n=1 Tax=Linum tenue TaxID=586396 RepID=A0AAV0PZR6_9ROSI|nr:unnamed protein product [Linum tenue]
MKTKRFWTVEESFWRRGSPGDGIRSSRTCRRLRQSAIGGI